MRFLAPNFTARCLCSSHSTASTSSKMSIAIALHDEATYPGVILPCKPIGMIEISEKKNGSVRTNKRIVAMPIWNDKLGEFEQVSELPKRLKEELERFFLSTSFFTSKKLKLKGWSDGKAATRYIKQSKVA
jgi:inorganic pyrophosphatase